MSSKSIVPLSVFLSTFLDFSHIRRCYMYVKKILLPVYSDYLTKEQCRIEPYEPPWLHCHWKSMQALCLWGGWSHSTVIRSSMCCHPAKSPEGRPAPANNASPAMCIWAHLSVNVNVWVCMACVWSEITGSLSVQACICCIMWKTVWWYCKCEYMRRCGLSSYRDERAALQSAITRPRQWLWTRVTPLP